MCQVYMRANNSQIDQSVSQSVDQSTRLTEYMYHTYSTMGTERRNFLVGVQCIDRSSCSQKVSLSYFPCGLKGSSKGAPLIQWSR